MTRVLLELVRVDAGARRSGPEAGGSIEGRAGIREAAEKRRAEQLKQIACAKKADEAKVMPRERTTWLTHCLEADAAQ